MSMMIRIVLAIVVTAASFGTTLYFWRHAADQSPIAKPKVVLVAALYSAIGALLY